MRGIAKPGASARPEPEGSARESLSGMSSCRTYGGFPTMTSNRPPRGGRGNAAAHPPSGASLTLSRATILCGRSGRRSSGEAVARSTDRRASSTDCGSTSIPYRLFRTISGGEASATPGPSAPPGPPPAPLRARISPYMSSSVPAASIRNAPEPHAGSSMRMPRSLSSSAAVSSMYSATREAGSVARPDLESHGTIVPRHTSRATRAGV